MPKFENRIVKNRPSPKNEDDYIDAYLDANKKANRKDGLDVSAVRAKDGTLGHALLKQDDNRSKDHEYHRGEGFIEDKELRKKMKK
jgi:hypothetical protein